MNGKSIAALILFTAASMDQAFTQTTMHQRVGVENKDIFGISAESAVAIYPSSINGISGVEIDHSLSLGFLYLRRFGITFDIPAVFFLGLERNSVPRAVGAAGDPSVSATYTFRLSDWRLSVGFSYTHPLGIWNRYEAAEKRILSGSGYSRLGATFSAVRFLDPLAIGTNLGADTCLARAELSGSSIAPLILTSGLFATEALNDIIAISAILTQRLAWPRYLDGVPDESGMTYYLFGSVSLVFNEENRTIRVGISKLLSDYASPFCFDLSAAHTFRKKE